MIEIPYTDDHSRNQERRNQALWMPCVVCGRAVKSPRSAMLRVFWGSHIVTEAEAKEIIGREGEGGDLLYYPIGPDCLRNNPALQCYADDARRLMDLWRAQEEAKET